MPLEAATDAGPPTDRAPEHVDVLIIGAGISGIGAAWRIQHKMPRKSFLIVEARGDLGGTWDLFRYPGIRSDSDMHTLGFDFKPWLEAKAIADGPSIKRYLRETVEENRIDRRIRFGHRVKRLSWDSNTAQWTAEIDTDAGPRRITAGFVVSGAGYYRYDRGYTPDFKAIERFRGQVVHPQLWPEDLDYADKRVLVIGSGATAVTIVPEIAKTAAHVTMLQRSPTYMITRPSVDAIASTLRKVLPRRAAYAMSRLKNIGLQLIGFRMARKQPQKMKEQLLTLVREQLPKDYDVETHFTPRYNPWDQRLCLVPDGDFFKAVSEGRATLVTDEIETFTEAGVTLNSGDSIEADIVVTATGLELQLLGGAELVVDGTPVNLPDTVVYRGMMFSGVPNLANVFGYTNASWTLRSDLVAERVCRLIRRMDHLGEAQATPVHPDPASAVTPFLDFSSGYVTRAMDRFPKQGDRAPWRINQNYLLDLFEIRYGRIEDGALKYGALAGASPRPSHAKAAPAEPKPEQASPETVAAE
ncbi:NAD(P)-binding protein [bacterium]|nr:NAD(P)-binding protein [bacterium]